jgi:hypothetical protein
VDLRVIDQRIFALEDRLSAEEARKKGEELSTKAFGTLAGLLMGAKREDIDVTYVERRYEPFWHILCTTHLEYNRQRDYAIALDAVVRNVVIDGRPYDACDKKLYLTGVENCVEDLRKEIFVDASSGNSVNFQKYIEHPKREIHQTEELMAGEDIVVPAKVKASYLTRNILGDMLKPVPADDILVEEIRIEKLHLYFRPIYLFEYLWKPKNKTATIEFDSVLLDYKSGGKPLKQKMKELVAEPDLFDIGADAVGMLVPGGGLAMKLARRAMKKK